VRTQKPLLYQNLLRTLHPSLPIQAFHLRSISAAACGPLSLITILRRMNIPLSEADIETIIGAAGSKGTSLMQLRQLAKRNGLSALGVELTAEELKRTGLYAVTHLNHTTFAAVTAYSKKGVQLVYTLKKPVVVSDKRFAKAFTGRTLLL
jgi:ABC-type bacteriocin/lantibiotic exporter with double-glycine peptidase domain